MCAAPCINTQHHTTTEIHTTILPAMVKLIIVLAFTALVAFASAHRPFVTTTTTTLIEELYSKKQCSQQLQGQRFNQCQSYITSSSRTQQYMCCYYLPGTGAKVCDPMSQIPCALISREGEQVLGKILDSSMGLEQCCNELKNVEEECQCEAMQEVYKQAQEQSSLQPQPQDLKQIVQNLRNECNLQVKQCRIPSAAMF